MLQCPDWVLLSPLAPGVMVAPVWTWSVDQTKSWLDAVDRGDTPIVTALHTNIMASDVVLSTDVLWQQRHNYEASWQTTCKIKIWTQVIVFLSSSIYCYVPRLPSTTPSWFRCFNEYTTPGMVMVKLPLRWLCIYPPDIGAGLTIKSAWFHLYPYFLLYHGWWCLAFINTTFSLALPQGSCSVQLVA